MQNKISLGMKNLSGLRDCLRELTSRLPLHILPASLQYFAKVECTQMNICGLIKKPISALKLRVKLVYLTLRTSNISDII